MPVTKKLSQARPRILMIPVDKLVATPDNRRRTITQASVESLAKSLAKDGVVQPIVVREHPEREGWWEIRAGERRWRAAKLAGLKEVPAIVRKLDDESALSVTIAENLQRLDLHPLEEAATIQQAFDRGYDVKAVAARLGKSVAYIARRASLTNLCKAWRDEVLRPDSEASRLSVAHLELIARLPTETQELLTDGSFHRVFARGFPSVEQLRRLIDGDLRSLRSMPWPLDDETLDPKAGSCLNCPKRSGMHPHLFEQEDAPQNGKVSKTDRCLDPACFERKQAGFLERRESELRGEHPSLRIVQLGFDRPPRLVAEKYGERATHIYHPKFVKPGHPGAVPAMPIDGPKAGSLVLLDLGESVVNTSSRKVARPTGPDGKPVPMSLEERKARLQKRRDAFLVAKVAEVLKGPTEESLSQLAARLALRADEASKKFDPLALVLAFGTSSRTDREHDDSPWKRYEELRGSKTKAPVVAALQEVAQVWSRRLGGSNSHIVTEQAVDARRMSALLGLDVNTINAEAEKAIPTPKSWAALADDSAREPEECPFDASPASSVPPPQRASTSTKKKRRKARR